MCEECEREVKDNRHACIDAYEAGWFAMKDGRMWCPDHVPDWVDGWRKGRRGTS